ncbi:UDP-glucuronosyltransferase 2B31-like [Belonocnema kinseyi]|uniref:UDP-glucuronosyltransferase 2B31-like n=1 Tax=Belonocnema kinseyi TaxID=2817044 RepID=UPI00143D450C|nr:UDP-glucuronosyltransferase 2B31-like [Belonocnema kinseyi]
MAPTLSLAIIVIVVIINSEKSDGARILGIFPLHGKSHFVICEQLMKTLAQKGHQVDVISHFPLKKPVPNYKDYSLEGTLPQIINNISFVEIQSISSGNLAHFMDICGDKICELLKHPTLNNIIKNPPKDPPYDLVIVEIFAAHCFFAFSRFLNVPMIGVTTAAIYDWANDPLGNPSNLAFSPGAFTSLPNKMNFWERLQNVIFVHIAKYQFNYYSGLQKKYVDEYFGPGYPSIYEMSTEFSLVFVNSHYSLNGIKPFTPGIVEVGGLHIEDKKEVLIPELKKWLDESKDGCIYVSFGSMVKIESFPKETLEIFYSTFKNIAPVRVLMKIAKPEELLPGLPENVKTYHWLPQIQILKHKNVKAFVTHGGLMGTLESIHCGVPMVGFPLFGDQMKNINSYEKKKIAVSLDYKSVTEKKFTNALNTVLKNREYRYNIEKISKLYYDRNMSPKDTAVFWTEYVLRHGNVLRSPAADLKWYQIQLLDVYGFILFTTLLVLYVALFIIRIFLKIIFRAKRGDKDGLLSKKRK